MAETSSYKPTPSACIRCGKCVGVCPMGLQPYAIRQSVENNDIYEMRLQHVQDCIFCGSCAYVCPAKLPLTDYCKIGKLELSKQPKKA